MSRVPLLIVFHRLPDQVKRWLYLDRHRGLFAPFLLSRSVIMFDEVEMFFVYYSMRSRLIHNGNMNDYIDLILSGALYPSNDDDFCTYWLNK